MPDPASDQNRPPVCPRALLAAPASSLGVVPARPSPWASSANQAGLRRRSSIRASSSGHRTAKLSQSGGYARGLSLVAVTVREDVCWAGAGSSGVARGARVYGKYMEGSSGVDGGCMGPAMPVVCLSIPGCAGGSGWGVPALSFPVLVNPAPGCFCLRVWGAVRACTWLSAGSAVKGPRARTYGGQRRRDKHH